MHDALLALPWLGRADRVTEACSMRQGDEGLCLIFKRMHGLAGRQSSPSPGLDERVVELSLALGPALRDA